MTASEESVSPDVTTHGHGDPEAAVVGGVHGDEPAGVEAIETLRDEAGLDEITFHEGVKLIVANPPAYGAGERYLDVDMNRTFPGDPDGDAREERLAARLLEEVDGLPTLSLHTTHSHPNPIALFDRDYPEALEHAAQLPVQHVVDQHDVADGSFPSSHLAVTVEAGRQHTKDATHTAKRIAKAFLRQTGAAVFEEPAPTSMPDYYRMDDAIGKPADEDWSLHVDNFHPVPAGTPYASTAEDYLVNAEPFCPVLMSENGYEDIFGYKGERVAETYEEARDAFADVATAAAED